MKRRIAAALCPAVLGLAASAAFSAGSGNAAGDARVASSIKTIMASMIDPSADALWGAVGTVVDKDQGIVELRPKTPAEWRDLRQAAIRMSEGANLLTIPGLQAAPAGTKSETPGIELEPAQITALVSKNRTSFVAFARALQGLGAEAMRAADSKDAGLLMDVGARMEDVCESCHQTFWYPQEKQR